MGCASSSEGASKNDGGTHLPKYEWVGELGSGRKGEIKLMRSRRTQELVAVKYIARQVKASSWTSSSDAAGNKRQNSCMSGLLLKLNCSTVP